MKRTLGTQLRHLVELLDGAVERAYEEVGLEYRPRYTPVMRVLIEHDGATVGEIAQGAGISQPAATQTIALMVRAGLVTADSESGDARRKIVRLTARGRKLVPELTRCWKATAAAAESLERDLGVPLADVLQRAIAALEQRSFDERIRHARSRTAKKG